MTPFHISMDTCSGVNLIRRTALPVGWRKYELPLNDAPPLGDANGNPLRLSAAVRLQVRFGNSTFFVPFMVADRLAVDVLLGTDFIDRRVRIIDVASR